MDPPQETPHSTRRRRGPEAMEGVKETLSLGPEMTTTTTIPNGAAHDFDSKVLRKSLRQGPTCNLSASSF